MRKILLISLLCVGLNSALVYASDVSFSKQLEFLQNEIQAISNAEGNDKQQLRFNIIKANINYIECGVIKKIKKLETHLKTFNNNLQNSQNGVEVQHWLKKVEATEKKIKTYNEILFGIEMLKVKVAG